MLLALRLLYEVPKSGSVPAIYTGPHFQGPEKFFDGVAYLTGAAFKFAAGNIHASGSAVVEISGTEMKFSSAKLSAKGSASAKITGTAFRFSNEEIPQPRPSVILGSTRNCAENDDGEALALIAKHL